MLRVLSSAPAPRPTTNPYLVRLHAALTATGGVRVVPFGWRAALRGDYEVFHVHWPELLVRGRTPARTAVRRALAGALLVRLRARRTAVVRTVHNPDPHEPGPPAERVFLAALDRLRTLEVLLTPDPDAGPGPGPTPGRLARRRGTPAVVIPHGDYRDAYAGLDRPDPVPGRLACVGLVRRYKDVDGLVRAFRALPDPDLTLHVAGDPAPAALAEQVRDAAACDPRVSLVLRHLDDAELVSELARAELVVVPTPELGNSGVLLAALSLNRPVLARDTPATRALAAEVGPGWVHTFPGRVDAAALGAGLAAVRADPPTGSPDLSARSWPALAAAHVAAYRRAVALSARPRSGSRTG